VRAGFICRDGEAADRGVLALCPARVSCVGVVNAHSLPAKTGTVATPDPAAAEEFYFPIVQH